MPQASQPHITVMPRTLYDEFASKFGRGEEREVTTAWLGRTYLIKELDPEQVGFAGAIGYADLDDFYYFALWWKAPRGDGFDPEPVFIIEAGAFQAGSWGAGMGHRMRETAKIYFRRDLSLEGVSLRLAAPILVRAHELTLASERPEFYEKDREPQGNYTRP